MSSSPVHIIANLEIHDADRYREYEKGFFPILKRHGGELVTLDDATVTLEGASPPPGRIVILRFASEEAARAWSKQLLNFVMANRASHDEYVVERVVPKKRARQVEQPFELTLNNEFAKRKMMAYAETARPKKRRHRAAGPQ